MSTEELVFAAFNVAVKKLCASTLNKSARYFTIVLHLEIQHWSKLRFYRVVLCKSCWNQAMGLKPQLHLKATLFAVRGYNMPSDLRWLFNFWQELQMQWVTSFLSCTLTSLELVKNFPWFFRTNLIKSCLTVLKATHAPTKKLVNVKSVQ